MLPDKPCKSDDRVKELNSSARVDELQQKLIMAEQAMDDKDGDLELSDI